LPKSYLDTSAFVGLRATIIVARTPYFKDQALV